MLIEDSLDTAAVVVKFGISMFCRLLLRIHLSRDHLAHSVVVLFYHYHLVDRHRNLKSILILYQHNIFALEASNLSAAHFAQESYFVTLFHIIII